MAQIVVTESGVVTVGNGDTVIIDIPGGGDVTIVADPTENLQTFRIEFVDDGQADTVAIDLGTFASTDLHIDIKDYDPTDQISLVGAFDTFVEPNNVDEFQFSYEGIDGEIYQGYVRAKDKDERDFTQDPTPIIICFCAETALQTTLGWKRADQIKPWDCVHTVDDGFQPVRWIGRHDLDADRLAAHPDLRPIIVEKGALGPASPRKRLRLSPQHRVLVTGWNVEMMFGVEEALVPIKALVDGVGIYPDTACHDVQYFHLLLDRHSVLNAEGCPAESLLMARQSARAIERDVIGPDNVDAERAFLHDMSTEAARPFLRVHEGRMLAGRIGQSAPPHLRGNAHRAPQEAALARAG